MKTVHQLFVNAMEDMLTCERRLVDALQEQEKHVSDPDLKSAISHHREETERQAQRLLQCFKEMGENAHETSALGCEGLINEYRDFIASNDPSKELTDLFTLAAALKVETFEIQSYRTLIDLAEMLGYRGLIPSLRQNLREEQQAHEKLQALQPMLRPEKLGAKEEIKRRKVA